jgi:DNA-binding CsgD family transcriptional regulator
VGAVQAGLAGRGVELELLAEALQGAASGSPCALVVHGEAGVGKTRLVREVCEALDAEVLWGTCVRFGEASVPFAPISGALQSWLHRADEATRSDVLSGAAELATVLPALGVARDAEPGRLLPLIDLVLNRLADRRPTVVVVDDLHWADRTSLDVLAYLIAGFRTQRLALLATCRDEHRGEGHPLHTWLADMRRMPHFTELRLGRLDLAQTQTQIEDLLDRPVDLGFAAQVHDRSGGNPYLTELLVRGTSGDEAELPATAPAELRDALLAGWHGLSADARQVTRLLAVAGRPIEPDVLSGVAAEHGVAPERLSGSLTEAQDQGVVRPEPDGRVWFRHPLLAEVLYDGVAPAQLVQMHTSYVRILRDGDDRGSATADLAVHNHRAGNLDEAFRWSLAAADQAAAMPAPAEEGVHLERACSLWSDVTAEVRGTPAERVALLLRAGSAFQKTGWLEAATSLVRQALDLVDREREPLLASALCVRWGELAWQQPAAGKKATIAELVEAVALTEPFPDSAERAMALAKLAWAEGWDSLPGAVGHADEAVRIAERSGSPLALASALVTRSSVHGDNADSSSLADAEQAEWLARAADDPGMLGMAATWRVNGLNSLDRTADATAVALEAYEDLLAAGAPQWAFFLAGQAAGGLLALGRWDECRRLLRTALAARCTALAGAAVRLVAARLAVRSGNVQEAEQHLARALEHVAADFVGLRDELAVSGAEVFTAAGEPQQALDWLRGWIAADGAEPLARDDELLVAYATAAADVAVSARDAGDARAADRAVADLGAAAARMPDAARPPRAVQVLRRARFAAETARCRDAADQADRWQRVVEAARAAGAPWDEAIGCWRQAGAAIAGGALKAQAAERTQVAELLRSAHRIAAALGARSLQGEVESLARMARVSLREAAAVPGPDPAVSSVLADLTAREREILALLVAGRSNGEIARHLVISDKTVSVHVSNILRKTGTSSRLEAAALAVRLDGGRPG